MALETATYIDSLVTSNPDGTDARNTADDHLRLIKAATKRSFPMIAGPVSASHQAVTYVNDLSAFAQAQLNTLREGSATANNAINARYAQSASYAANAGQAASAGFATLAATANSASYASNAGSASFATACTSASVATVATTANNALSLGGVAAAGYAQLAQPQSFTKGQAITQINSTGTPLAPNCDSGTMFRHTLNGTTVINAPTAPRSGMVITLHLIQSTGGHTVTWSSAYKFAGGTAPTLSTGSSDVDVFAFQYDSTSGVWRASGLNVS